MLLHEINFTFDAVFDQQATQEEVYQKAAASVVESVCHGQNGSILAHGQSGSGKSYTMIGGEDCACSDPGINVLALAHIFEHAQRTNCAFVQVKVELSFLDLYQE